MVNHPRLISGFATNNFTRSGNADEGQIIVAGAGLAGLFTALKLSPRPVTVITASQLGNGAASAWAQGGIAAAVGEDDTCEAHAADTITAGAGLVDDTVAKLVADEAPDRIADLLRIGVPFDQRDDGTFDLSREAAHSKKRIVRVSGDKAGAAIMQALIAEVRKTPSIRILEMTEFTDITLKDGAVSGVQVRTSCNDGTIINALFPASAVVLATGGIGALYAVTTNPPYARGQALAIAARAGALICDAEFVQFHPTALDVGLDPAPLATESLRGEGAKLVNKNGDPFMERYHPDGDLAPRDLVASAVLQEKNAGRGAYLDCRGTVGRSIATHFPTVYAHSQKAGLDPTSDLLPVAPAAHYHMGGLATDLRARTNVTGLWAVGEVAATGLHGANRLASNSLLENVVFANRAATDITSISDISSKTQNSSGELKLSTLATNDNTHDRTKSLQRLRELMSRNVGVARDANGLKATTTELALLADQNLSNRTVADSILAARLITAAAANRNENRGANIRTDLPQTHQKPGRHSYLTLSDVEPPQSAHPALETIQSHREPFTLEATLS